MFGSTNNGLLSLGGWREVESNPTGIANLVKGLVASSVKRLKSSFNRHKATLPFYFKGIVMIMKKALEHFSLENLLPKILEEYERPHRHWHGVKHLDSIVKRIYGTDLEEKEKTLLIVATLFHDIVYFPMREGYNNEGLSAMIFEELASGDQKDIETVGTIIRETRGEAKSELGKIFNSFDRAILTSESFEELLEYEKGIFKEYQSYDYSRYKEKRVEFLEKNMTSSEKDRLIDYINNRKLNIGVYAGSFNPFHLGHLSVLETAESMGFDKVIVALGKNSEKEERFSSPSTCGLSNALGFRDVKTYSGMLTDFLSEVSSKGVNVTLIRGLRTGEDLNYEKNLMAYLKDSDKSIKACHILCEPELAHISSSSIRALLKTKGGQDLAMKYKIPNYLKVLHKEFS